MSIVNTHKGIRHVLFGADIIYKDDGSRLLLEYEGKTCRVTSPFGICDPYLWRKFNLKTLEDLGKVVYENKNKFIENYIFKVTFERFTDLSEPFYGIHYLEDFLRMFLRKIKEYRSGVSGLEDSLETLIVPSGDFSEDFYLLEESPKELTEITYSKHTWGPACTKKLVYTTGSERNFNDFWYGLLNYSFKPTQSENDLTVPFRSRPTEVSPMMYGMEVEISTKLSCEELQRIVTDVEPKQDPFFYMKSDSSVGGRYTNKVELVTIPASRRYLAKAWRLFFDKIGMLCSQKNYDVDDLFDTSTDLNNGIHIHLSKKLFPKGFKSRESMALRKFVVLFNDWRPDTVSSLNRLSRRPQNYKDNCYCKPNGEFYGRTLYYRLTRTTNLASERKTVCHVLSKHTVEVRLFQGIFCLDHILTCLETVDAFFFASTQLPISSLNRGTGVRSVVEVAKREPKRYSRFLRALEEK